jgi:CRISPR-associated endonuclease/helicase Cas3
MLAYIVAGHHAGLADFAELDRRVARKEIDPYPRWQALAGRLPDIAAMKPPRAPNGARSPGFGAAFLTRMLFSSLVDADSLVTEEFVNQVPARPWHAAVISAWWNCGIDCVCI